MKHDLLRNIRELSEAKLNINDKTRTSKFPWRGQFSPELIEYLLESFFKDSEIIYDPFSGSGTVLFESSYMGKNSIGSEINPAAWCLSSTLKLNTLSHKENLDLINRIEKIISSGTDIDKTIEYTKETNDDYLKISLTAILLVAAGNGKHIEQKKLEKSKNNFLGFLNSINQYTGNSTITLEDCRDTSISNDSIDGVITSPPYINVFNYHQNYRPIMELLGWSPLKIATSEIGANRKFRQNRFLTVIQYTQDMAQSLDELSRVMKLNSLCIMVVGRESKVLGESFSNSNIIIKLVKKHKSFDLIHKRERKFKNKFGQEIVEDLIFFQKTSHYHQLPTTDSTDIGLELLSSKIEKSVLNNLALIQNAIDNNCRVKPSPLLDFRNYE